MHGVVIVGGGHAALTTAQQLRRLGYSDRVVLLSEEDVAPYDRPSLSKGILDGEPPALADPSALDELGIEVETGSLVEELSPGGVIVNGATVHADHVVLATGASAVMPSAFPRMPSIHALRTAEDARWLRMDLEAARDVVLVGGGLVNSELASVLARRGDVEVHVVDPVPAPLDRVLGSTVGEELRRRTIADGVVRHASTVARVVSTGRSLLVETGSGERVRADCMVVGVGAAPRTELALRAGAVVDDGVVCDQQGRTSLPGLYAVGDVASWPSTRFGRVRTGHWKAAIDQAAIVAHAITGSGSSEPPESVPWFWTEQFGVRVEVAGLLAPGLRERVVHSGSDEIEVVAETAEGEVVAVIGMNTFQGCRRFRQGKQWEVAS